MKTIEQLLLDKRTEILEGHHIYSREEVANMLNKLVDDVINLRDTIKLVENTTIDIEEIYHFIDTAMVLDDEILTNCVELHIDNWNNQIQVTMVDNVRNELKEELDTYLINNKK